MNFATLKGLTIPEGAVKQIADADGNVLWKSAPAIATVTITGLNGYTDVTIVGFEYTGSLLTPSVIEVPIGTEVICTVTDSAYSGNPYITLNGTTVSNDTYTYIVVGNVTIERTDDYTIGGGGKDPYGVIHITEE